MPALTNRAHASEKHFLRLGNYRLQNILKYTLDNGKCSISADESSGHAAMKQMPGTSRCC